VGLGCDRSHRAPVFCGCGSALDPEDARAATCNSHNRRLSARNLDRAVGALADRRSPSRHLVNSDLTTLEGLGGRPCHSVGSGTTPALHARAGGAASRSRTLLAGRGGSVPSVGPALSCTDCEDRPGQHDRHLSAPMVSRAWTRNRVSQPRSVAPQCSLRRIGSYRPARRPNAPAMAPSSVDSFQFPVD
jgi:hypothetical protein